MRIRLGLAMTLAATTAWSWDSTVVYKNGVKEGKMLLDANPRLYEASSTMLQGIRFDLGNQIFVTLSNTGLPDFNASCNGISYNALIVNHDQGLSGFRDAGTDSIWNHSGSFPTHFFPLDSIKDRYPDITKRAAFVGKGWIHSSDEFQGCATLQQKVHPRAKRIFYYQFQNAVYLRVQVESFETQPGGCTNTGIDPCTKSKYFTLQYAITDARGGEFVFPSTTIHTQRGRDIQLRQAYSRPIWEYVLGRRIESFRR